MSNREGNKEIHTEIDEDMLQVPPRDNALGVMPVNR